MSLARIEQTLKERIGLHAGTVGRTAISSAVGRRMAVLDIGEVHNYCEYVLSRTEELSELIETVVIPETWFFRDGRPFEGLKRLVRGAPERTWRALSVPCSTGEEAYSLAISLLEGGVAATRFQVDAVDVSRRALEFARAGRYGSHSFRGQQDPSVIDRYFRREHARLCIDERVRERVRFSHGNILDGGLQPSTGPYDIIFCRNLLIYFDEKTKEHAFRTLHRLLAEDGTLFVGHAECATVPNTLFHSAGDGFAFAFRKGVDPRTTVRARAAHNAAWATPHAVPSTPAPDRRPSRPRHSAPPPAAPRTPEGNPLQVARQLADLGRLQEARDICEAHLGEGGGRADAYFLLGVIRAAEGDAEGAEEALRRTVYLAPRHYEALVHLALMLERKGDCAGAQRLRQRAARVAPRHES